MNSAIEASALRDLLLGLSDVLPPGFQPIIPGTSRGLYLYRELGPSFPFQAADIFHAGRSGPAAEEPLVAILLVANHEATIGRDVGQVKRNVEVLRKLRPNDLSYRLQSATTLNDFGEHDLVVELLQTHASDLTAYLPSTQGHLDAYIFSAFKAGRLDLISGLSPDVGAQVAQGPHTEAQRVRDRVADLHRLGAADVCRAGVLEQKTPLERASLALSEHEMDDWLSQVRTNEGGEAELCLALSIAALALGLHWSGPYRRALSIAAGVLAQTGAIEAARSQWLTTWLPQSSFESLVIAAVTSMGAGKVAVERLQQEAEWRRACERAGFDSRTDLEHAYVEAIEAFCRVPAFSTAEAVWSLAYLLGRFVDVVRSAPAEIAPDSPAERARALQTASPSKPGPESPLWVLMTWLADADRLLQTLSAYAGRGRIIVTVGGDSHTPGMARASALLLCRDAFLLTRPVVTWGGQRCMFHNLLEVMTAMQTQAPADAWLQIVCDRSYPVRSLRRLRRMTAEGQIWPTGAGPRAWRDEFLDPFAATNLAKHYSEAFDDLFGACRPERLLELETKSPTFGFNDNRMNAHVFNFSSESLRHAWDHGGGGWHKWMISPYEADTRWMSYARLQEYVDVSTESMTTYVRRLQPPVMRWVQDVLLKYDLRTGDPWVYISRKYIDRVIGDAGFSELYAAMNLGFAPEMNFLDTVAASFSLYDDFIHHYHVVPEEVARDAFLAQTCAAADQKGRFFIRKTDPTIGRELINFFARRILDEEVGDGLHWFVATGDYASDERDPRPYLDDVLLQRFMGRRVVIRDMLDRRRYEGLVDADGVVSPSDGQRLATWRWEDGSLLVTFTDPTLGTKQYERVAGEYPFLTLAPSELVAPANGWSAFLDFELAEVDAGLDVERVATGRSLSALSVSSTWIGAGVAEAGLLKAFSDPNRSDFPTPTVEAQGGVFAIRSVRGVPIALCSIDGFPVLLKIAGFAEAGPRTVVHLKSATHDQRQAWDNAANCAPVEHLHRSELPGLWRFTLVDRSFEVELFSDGSICSGGQERVGRWCLRPDGLQVLGLASLRFATADHYRLEDSTWRLSGWGWVNLRDAVTFAMEQVRS